MKKLLLLLTALLAMAGCTQPDDPTGGGGNDDGPGTKKEKLSVSVSELRFTASGGVQTFTVTTSAKNVDAGSYHTFLTCSISGNTVTVTASPNTMAEERKGTVVVTAGAESCEIPVVQEARSSSENAAGTADGYNPYPEYDFEVNDGTRFMRDNVAQGITSLDLESTTFYLSPDISPELVPQTGEYYIVNNRFDLFPEGIIMRIQDVEKTGEGYRIYYSRESMLSAFKSLHIDDQDIDVASHIEKILDGDGNELTFTKTRAVSTDKWTVTMPEMSWDIGKGWELTPKLTLDNTLRLQLIMDDWRISTLNIKYDVDATLGADLAISGEKELLNSSKKLLTIVCGAIPVGPVVITPNIDVFAYFGASGSISFEGSITYKTGAVFNVHYDEAYGLSGDWQKKDGDKIEYSIGPKISGKFEYGLQFGPAIGFYGHVLEVGVSVSTTMAEELSYKYNFADPMTWGGFYESWGQALQEGEYSISYVLGGNVFLTGMGFPLSCTLKDAKFPLESRKLIPTVSKEYRAEANGKDLTFRTWIKNKALDYPSLYLDIGDGQLYPFDLDDGKIAELEAGADSVMITTRLTVEGDQTEHFFIRGEYLGKDVILREHTGSMRMVDEDEEYAMKQILADLYACRGGDWDGCEWPTANYGIANMQNIDMSVRSNNEHNYTILITKEWPLGDNLYVGNHSSKVKNFSWSLDYEGDTHFNTVQIEDPCCRRAFVGPDCDTFIQHCKLEDGNDLTFPAHVQTLDIAGCPITYFSAAPSSNGNGFQPKKVILDNCQKLETISIGFSGSDYKEELLYKNPPLISTKKCSKLKNFYLRYAVADASFFNDIEMNGGKLSLYHVSGLDNFQLKTNCEWLGVVDSQVGNFNATTALSALKEIYFSTSTYRTATVSGLPALTAVDMSRNLCEKISITQCNALEKIRIDNYWEDSYNVGALSVTDCPSLKTLYCPCIGMSSFEASGLPVIEKLDCSYNKNLTGLMLPVFDQMFNAGYQPEYDIRYEYEWEELKKDNGYGYYYAGEPERGYHRYADD